MIVQFYFHWYSYFKLLKSLSFVAVFIKLLYPKPYVRVSVTKIIMCYYQYRIGFARVNLELGN